MAKQKSEFDKLLERAKMQLMLLPDTLFYSTILFSLKTMWADDLPTAAVDGTTIWINPKWFKALEPKPRIGTLVHEVLHVGLNHITRRGSRDPEIFNQAADYIINNMMDKMGYELPANVLIDHDRFTPDMNAENAYALLWKEHTDDLANGGPGLKGVSYGIGPDVKSPKTAAANSKVEQDIADIVLRASTQARQLGGPGSVPGDVTIALDKLINPKLPWNVIYQNHMQGFAKDDFSWQKPNRRFQPEWLLPSAFGEGLSNICEAVDSSGSVTQSQFSFFINETEVVQQTMKPEKITVIDFDTKISDIQEITEGTDILNDLKFKGGGGTNILPVFKWAIENEPDILTIFTDGDFSIPDKKYFPDCPIIWLIHNNPGFKIDIGEIIHYEI